MGMLLFSMYALICLVLVAQLVLLNFMELRNKKHKDGKDVNTSSPEEMQPPRDDDDDANDTDATPPRPKRKKKDGEGSSSSNSFCRFCKQTFQSPQALGGHMNRHRGEREKEEFQKAEILINTRGQNFASRYPSGGAPSYYQSDGNYGNYYQSGGIQMANTSMVENMGGGGLQRQGYQNSNQQQFVGAPQMNPNYGNHQQTAQANYQTQPQQGGSYVNYNQGDNTTRPLHIPSGVPQTSSMPWANSGQYQAQQGTGRDARPYTMSQGGSSTGVAQHQSNTGFTAHNLSQAAAGGGATSTMPTLDNIATPAPGSNSNAGLRQQSTANQAVGAQFVDQRGNIVIQGPSSGYSTGLRPLNASHFNDNVLQAVVATEYDRGLPQDQFTGQQASYAGPSSVHGTIHVQSDQYNASGGMENQYPASDMLNFEALHEGDEFGNGGPDMSTIAMTGSGHGDGVGSTGRSADAGSQLS